MSDSRTDPGGTFGDKPMKLTDEQLAFFVAKYGAKPPTNAYIADKNDYGNKLRAFTLGLSHQQAEVDRLRKALTVELGVWEFYKKYAVTHHSRVQSCLRIETITAALAPDNATPGEKT